MVGITFFWGINWPIMKIAMLEIPVFTFRAIVLFAGGLSLFIICKMLKFPLIPPRAAWLPMICISIALFIFQLFSGYGVLLTESGRAAVMAYTMPVWAIGLGWLFLNERPGWRSLIALGLGMSGMVMLITTDIDAIGGAPIGMIFMLITAISWAVATVIQKQVKWKVPTLTIVAWQVFLGALPMAIGSLFEDYSDVPFPSIPAILCLIYNAFIAAAFCFWAYMEVVRLYPVGVATIGIMLTPIVGIFSGAIMLNEPLGAAEFVSMLLVSAAIGFPVFARKTAWRKNEGQ